MFRKWTGTWYQLRSTTGVGYSVFWGTTDDVPLVGDYDGDSRADPTVFRASTGTWYQLRSTTGAGYGVVWSAPGTLPPSVPALPRVTISGPGNARVGDVAVFAVTVRLPVGVSKYLFDPGDGAGRTEINSTAASVIWRHIYATVGWHVVTVTVMTTRGNYVQHTLILVTV